MSLVTPDHPLPAEVDVAIVGGGIIGVCTALSAARLGLRVALLEKGRLGGEQSSRNWGWVRTLMRDLPEVPLAMRANVLWGEIQAQAEVGFQRCGLLYLQENDADAAAHDRWLKQAQHHGVQAEMLDRRAVSARLPASSRTWTGALYSQTDGVAEPALATAAIAALARAQGVYIAELCAVRGLETQAGTVSAVVTEAGTLRAGAVVVAAGAWSRLFCGNLGVEFPQLKVRGTVLRTTPIDLPVSAAINGKDFTVRKRADGGYTVSQFGASIIDIVPDNFRLMPQFLRPWLANNTLVRLRVGRRLLHELGVPRRFSLTQVSPFERERVLDPPPYAPGAQQAWQRLTQAFPAFAAAQMASSWAGYIDVTPDAMPVIDAIDGIPGLFLASGFSGHGFGIGPSVGEAMAQWVAGLTPSVDVSAFRLARYG